MIFLDTSALVKRYLREEHSEALLEIMEADRVWAASEMGAAEAHVTLCARLAAPALRDEARRRLDLDWTLFTVVVLGDDIDRACGLDCM